LGKADSFLDYIDYFGTSGKIFYKIWPCGIPAFLKAILRGNIKFLS
jgi:hypothetical protein